MFKVEPIYVSKEPNPGDPFLITCSRNELEILRAGLNYYMTTCTSLPEDYMLKQIDILAKLRTAANASA